MREEWKLATIRGIVGSLWCRRRSRKRAVCVCMCGSKVFTSSMVSVLCELYALLRQSYYYVVGLVAQLAGTTLDASSHASHYGTSK